MSRKVYGIWDVIKDEPSDTRQFMEWWPSISAAHASLRARLYSGGGLPTFDPARYVFRPDRPDAQWGGGMKQSGIRLYASPEASEPYAVLEFGPRGGIRQSPVRAPIEQ